MKLKIFFSCLFVTVAGNYLNVIVDNNKILNRIDDTFLSVNIDGGAATTNWYSGVIQFG